MGGSSLLHPQRIPDYDFLITGRKTSAYRRALGISQIEQVVDARYARPGVELVEHEPVQHARRVEPAEDFVEQGGGSETVALSLTRRD